MYQKVLSVLKRHAGYSKTVYLEEQPLWHKVGMDQSTFNQILKDLYYMGMITIKATRSGWIYEVKIVE